MELEINVTTEEAAEYSLSGKSPKREGCRDTFIGGISTSLGFSDNNCDLRGVSLNSKLLHSILNTFCLTPLNLYRITPSIAISVKRDGIADKDIVEGSFNSNGNVYANFYCHLFNSNSDFSGSKNYGAQASDICKYVFYSNLKSATHIRRGLGGCVTEDFFIYKDVIVNDSVANSTGDRHTVKYTQYGEKTLNDIYPLETEDSNKAVRSVIYAKEVLKVFRQIGIGDTYIKKVESEGVEYDSLFFNVTKDYLMSNGLDGFGTELNNNLYEISFDDIDVAVFEIMHICNDLIRFRSHFPVILINCIDYANLYPSSLIPLLQGFNNFVRKATGGIVLYFNVGPELVGCCDCMLDVKSL